MRLINKFIILVYGSMFFSLLNADDAFLNLPNIDEFTLNNGMRVLFSPNYDYPTVYCHVYVNRGMLDDPENGGLPQEHNLPIKEIRISAGAEFVVVICGDIMLMPGLPKVPAAESIYIDEKGLIQGLF